MSKLRISILKQNQLFQELSERLDYYTINDPIYNSKHINVVVKTKRQEHSKIIVDHFYSRKYLTEIYEGNFLAVRKSLVWMLICLSILIAILLAILIITFTYLENKSLSLIPLFSLIIITILILFLTINIIRLKVINKFINQEYEIDRKFVYLCIYKLSIEEQEDTNFSGLSDECTRLKDDCTS